MELYHIVAVAKGNVIGKGNQLPWHFSEDMKHFKKLTMGNTVIMGRKTFESIGRALPGRENFVLSKTRSSPNALTLAPNARSTFREERDVLLRKCVGDPNSGFPLKACGNDKKVRFFDSIEQALEAVKTQKAFIIGGAEIFRQTIDVVDGIYLTSIKDHYEGDAYYPEIPNRFREKERIASSENPKLEYITYEKEQ